MTCPAPTTNRYSVTSSVTWSATATTSVAHCRIWQRSEAVRSPTCNRSADPKWPAAFREVGGPPLAALVRVVLLCYYRDDRVMRSLGQETRAPFPLGHVVEQGDWSLLDPVRARPPMYRVVE